MIKSPLWWNAFERLFTFKLSKKSQVSKDSFQLIFHFWFERRSWNCAIIRHGPRDNAKKESRKFSSVIGFFGEMQLKSQYFWSSQTENSSLFRNAFH